ncbi:MULTISPECIES: hypothetical protein [unclassified Polaribacter]|jgi:Flp pilus assembly CpaF family ATPase|uniref:hypothetical protein n=1 Tax=unclassified Polaribacter TaxID=196858 RepID=UPI000B10F757|nr:MULTISPECIES: hypothetical protein [unclassified Polaribacter]PKV65778.1 hypothetical protein ATE90_2226 [Polaribacter sp. Hel1_33_96]
MEIQKEVLYNSNMHFEHQQWNRELAFWQDELKSFNNRLSELVTRWTDKYVLAQLEHYQNEFVLHGGVIEDLLEAIEKHEISIASQTKTGIEVLNSSLAKNHIEFRNRLDSQRHIYAELKTEFFRFLSKYM